MVKWIVWANIIFFLFLYLVLKEQIDYTYFYWSKIYEASKIREEDTYAFKAGYKTPPFPDYSSNLGTLRGVDSNKNGVRDDVEYFIHRTAKDDVELRLYYQKARTLDFALTYKDTDESGESINPAQFGVGEKFARVRSCDIGVTNQEKYKHVNVMNIFKIFSNTAERRSFIRDKIYNNGFSEGHSPDEQFKENLEYCD